MKRKRLARLIACVLLLCLALSGCASSEGQPASGTAEATQLTESATDEWPDSPDFMVPRGPNPELDRLNSALNYTRCYYSYPRELYADTARETFHKLADTQVSDSPLVDWQIISNTEGLVDLDQDISNIEAVYQECEPDRNDWKIVSQTRRTKNVEYDEEFFRNNDLLLVDLSMEGPHYARYYPENLEVSGDTVSLDIRWDCDNSFSGCCVGQYCLIAIPKGCTTAALNIIRDTGEG